MFIFTEIDREMFKKLSHLLPAPGVRSCDGWRPLAITQALLRSDCVALAVCKDGEPVGYLEYSILPGAGRYRLHTLFAAAGGHSADCLEAALEYLVQTALADPACGCIEVWVREEEGEGALYEALGFTFTSSTRGLCRQMLLEWSPHETSKLPKARPVTLRALTRENFKAVAALSVAPGQEGWVTSNALSMAQACVQCECLPLAIYEGELPVGFLMYCVDVDDGEWWTPATRAAASARRHWPCCSSACAARAPAALSAWASTLRARPPWPFTGTWALPSPDARPVPSASWSSSGNPPCIMLYFSAISIRHKKAGHL